MSHATEIEDDGSALAVTFNKHTPKERIREILRRLGLQLLPGYSLDNPVLIVMTPEGKDQAYADRLLALPEVRSVEFNTPDWETVSSLPG